MTALLFADTNILIYAMDPNEPAKRAGAVKVLDRCAARRSLVTSPQSLNECYRVLTERRQLVPAEEARTYLKSLAWSCIAPLDWQTIVKAWQIADERSYHWWDCLLLAAATRANCSIFATEDLQHGDEIDGMFLVNPFVTDLSAII